MTLKYCPYLIIPNTCPWHIYQSWTLELQQFIWHFHWDVTGQHKPHCSIMLENSLANLPNSSWWNHIHPFVHAKNLSQCSFPSFTSRVQSLQCTLPGATTGDPTHDKGHAEKTWQAKADQDSKDSLDLFEHLPRNQNLSVYCLLYYAFQPLFWY